MYLLSLRLGFGADRNHPLIYLSYATPDRHVAEALTFSLALRGVRVWIDKDDIAGGDDIAETILQGVENTACMVVLLSNGSIKSSAVGAEIGMAMYKQKFVDETYALIPVMVGTPKVPTIVTRVKYLSLDLDNLEYVVDKLIEIMRPFGVR